MVKPIDLSVSQEIRADGTRRTISLRNAGSSGADSLEIHVDLLGETDVPAPDVLDGFVIGVIFHAMASGRPLRIHGALSRSACMNLHEYQAAWMVWQPGRYRQVELIPDSVVDLPIATQPPRAISAFSGGVDGSFTAVRHARGWLGNASYPLHDVALVQGFDVPLDDDAGFERLVLRIRPLIDALGVRRNLKAEYFILTDPLIIIAGALLLEKLNALRFSRWAYPIGAALIVAHVAVSQAEPIKHVMKRSGPEYICEWNEYYQPLLPMPWCDKPPKRP